MPSFVGQALGSVSRSLQDAGFRLGNVSVAEPSIVLAEDTTNPSAPVAPIGAGVASRAQRLTPAQATPASIIVSQAPAAGQKVFAGAVVNFEVR